MNRGSSLENEKETYEEAQARADWADIGSATGLSQEQIRHLHALAIGYELCPEIDPMEHEKNN